MVGLNPSMRLRSIPTRQPAPGYSPSSMFKSLNPSIRFRSIATPLRTSSSATRRGLPSLNPSLRLRSIPTQDRDIKKAEYKTVSIPQYGSGQFPRGPSGGHERIAEESQSLNTAQVNSHNPKLRIDVHTNVVTRLNPSLRLRSIPTFFMRRRRKETLMYPSLNPSIRLRLIPTAGPASPCGGETSGVLSCYPLGKALKSAS
jgi:hypothetical protein